MKEFNQARVNVGSNYDSLKVAKCLVKWITEIRTVFIYYLAKPQPRETGLTKSAGKEDPVELVSGLTL